MEIIDGMCHCKDCENRTQETYLLSAKCYNCDERHVFKFRKGDRPVTKECPRCGVRALHYGSSEEARILLRGSIAR